MSSSDLFGHEPEDEDETTAAADDPADGGGLESVLAGGEDDAEDRRARRRRRVRARIISFLVLALVLAGVAYVGMRALGSVRDVAAEQTQVSDYTGTGEDDVVVTVPDGASGSEIGQVLKDADVVASVGAFTDAYNANSHSGNIQAGTYSLKTHMSAANAVAALLDPASKSDHALTIPEGSTKDQVKERLISVGGFTSDEVDAAFKDTKGIGLPDVADGDVEGWLAPSSYDVPEDADATDVVASMVAKTVSTLKSLGIDEKDWEKDLTEASIVEREVSSTTYYGQVARVIENRLTQRDAETKGYLQMDSTVLYGLGRTGGIPSSDEIADKSNKYNTYQHQGLTPTPIGSPGEDALKAVMDPPEGDWLYFVTVDLESGETLFATSLDEQKKNTEKLTEYCKRNADVCSGSTASADPSDAATRG